MLWKDTAGISFILSALTAEAEPAYADYLKVPYPVTMTSSIT